MICRAGGHRLRCPLTQSCRYACCDFCCAGVVLPAACRHPHCARASVFYTGTQSVRQRTTPWPSNQDPGPASTHTGCDLECVCFSRHRQPLAAQRCRRQLAVTVRAEVRAATLDKPDTTPAVQAVEDKSIWKTTYDISNVRGPRGRPYEPDRHVDGQSCVNFLSTTASAQLCFWSTVLGCTCCIRSQAGAAASEHAA